MQQRKELVDELILLKQKLSKASLPIQDKIFRLSELKAELVMLNKIDTTEGVNYSYSDVPAEYEVVFDKAKIKEMADKINEEINLLQDQIEEFNYNTEI